MSQDHTETGIDMTDELRAIKAANERMEAKMAEFIEAAIRKVLGQ